MLIKIDPVSKPRQTRSDVWKKRPCVVRYRSFADDLRAACGDYRPSDEIALVFHIQMPPSWSKKKMTEMNGTPHKQKPDIDNLIKSVLDALFKEDSGIHTVAAKKVWAIEGAIEIK